MWNIHILAKTQKNCCSTKSYNCAFDRRVFWNMNDDFIKFHNNHLSSGQIRLLFKWRIPTNNAIAYISMIILATNFCRSRKKKKRCQGCSIRKTVHWKRSSALATANIGHLCVHNNNNNKKKCLSIRTDSRDWEITFSANWFWKWIERLTKSQLEPKIRPFNRVCVLLRLTRQRRK